MKRFLAAVLAACFLASPALAEDCTPIAKAEAMVPLFVLLKGDDAKRAVVIYNALPPASNDPWDTSAVGYMPDGNGFLAVGANGALCRILPVPRQAFPGLLAQIMGQAI